MTVTLGRFVWPDHTGVGVGPSVAVGQVGLDVDGLDVTLHLYGMGVEDVWDLTSWARLAEGTVQPFTVTGEASVSRWWRVESVQVDSWAVKASGQVKVRLRLGVIRDGGRPIVESLLHGAARGRTVVAIPFASAQAWHAVPASAADWYSVVRGSGTLSSATVTCDGGDQVARFVSTVNADLYQGASAQQPAVVTYPLVPGDAMVGAARVEVRVGGVWRTVHGLELPAGVAPEDVRVCNGLARITGTNISAVLSEAYSGAAWTPAHLVGVNGNNFVRASVRRNSAAAVTVVWDSGDGYQLSCMLRRGAYLPIFTATFASPGVHIVEVLGRDGSITTRTDASGTFAEYAPTADGDIVLLGWVLGHPITPPSNGILWQGSISRSNSAAFTAGTLPAGHTTSIELDRWHAQQAERVVVP